ncbi:hypothetical protein E8E13_000162 [Curvularia kusanoi]|uniref:Rhodopsin domain-containing protein n=1 Tax=Curvularia kusanoi TaxID=90978 RepID=A0A9P4T9F8_CURKU|nr:hypothetical protein E8E13_000162 [Curvularia kusanoi]
MGSRTSNIREDRSPVIEIATYASAGALILFFIARQIMKAIVFRKVALDDLFILMATSFAIGLSATTLILTSKGFGILAFLSDERADTIMKGLYASELLYVFSLCFAKLSILVLFYNVVVLRTHRFFVLGFGICIFAWSVASAGATAFQCDMPRPWEMMTLRCFNTRIFWLVYCAIDMSTELFIVMLSVDLVAHLRVRMSRKLAVVACFAPRLLVVAAALVRAVYFYQVTPHSRPEYDLWIATVCTQVHVCVSICTACIPYMVPFFKSLQGNMWRSYSTRSWSTKSRFSHLSGQSPNRLRKREANIRFESPKSSRNLVKMPERVSIVSPRIPSPMPISPFMPPPISSLQLSLNLPNQAEPGEARRLSTSDTLYDSDSEEVFDMVSLQTAISFAPAPITPPAQARFSSAAVMDMEESFDYLALLGNSDSSSSSSCYSSCASTPTRSEATTRFSLFPRESLYYMPLHSAAHLSVPSVVNPGGNQVPTETDQMTRTLARQTLPAPIRSHDFDDFAHPARSASSRSHPKFSTTPRLHAPPPTAMSPDCS